MKAEINIFDPNMTYVLWVDDCIFGQEEISSKALDCGLSLKKVNSWDDAKTELAKSYDIWSAIIIDPKTKLHHGSFKNPHQLLPNIFADLALLGEKNNRIIPWYIFTDEVPETFNDLIIESRLSFDGDWNNNYYSKSDSKHVNALFSRIRYHVRQADRLTLRNKYSKLYSSLSYLEENGLDVDVELNIEDLLLELHLGGDTYSNFDKIRISLEHIFESMVKNNILPDSLLNDAGHRNVKGCSLLLSGKDFYINGRTYKPLKILFDNVIAENIKYMINISNASLHAKNDCCNDNTFKLKKYLTTVKTSNLLHSFTLQICDVVIYYAEILKDYKDNGNNYPFYEIV